MIYAFINGPFIRLKRYRKKPLPIRVTTILIVIAAIVYVMTNTGPVGASKRTETRIPRITEATPQPHASGNFFRAVDAAKAGRIKLANTTNTPTNWTDDVIATAKIK